MPNLNEPAMLVDQSLCVGCEACTAVCKQVYQLSKGVFRTKMNKKYETASDMSVINKNACMFCKDAACVMACPTGACHKNELGLTEINHSICIECNYCIANCPFGAISFDRARNRIEKCDMCTHRIYDGKAPLCAEVCTSRIIKFGERDELLHMAYQRVEKLTEQGYQEANVYGADELGGLQVILVLQDQPQEYGLPADPQIPWNLRLWSEVPVGPLAIVAGALVLGANFLSSKKLQGSIKKPKK